MFFPEVSVWDMILFLAVIILVGGFGVYVAIPWLWAMLIKPGLVWILLTF